MSKKNNSMTVSELYDKCVAEKSKTAAPGTVKCYRILSIIDYLKMKNTPVDEIIAEVVKTFDVTDEYVKSLMDAKPA